MTKILTSALIAGAVAGLIAGLLQFFYIQPVLLYAEMFESGAMVHTGASPVHLGLPTIEATRNLLSIAFAMLTYAGYGLILVALMAAAETQGTTITGRRGLMWGVAGFVAVHLAPGFGLPPEVPGSAAADLGDRQVWWFATVAATALGLWLIAFGKNPVFWGIAIILLAAPHIIGAPEPEVLTATAPTEVGGLFAARSLGVGLAVWAILGVLAGHLWTQADEV